MGVKSSITFINVTLESKLSAFADIGKGHLVLRRANDINATGGFGGRL